MLPLSSHSSPRPCLVHACPCLFFPSRTLLTPNKHHGKRNGMSGSARGGAEHLARIHGTEEDKVCTYMLLFVLGCE